MEQANEGVELYALATNFLEGVVWWHQKIGFNERLKKLKDCRQSPVRGARKTKKGRLLHAGARSSLDRS